MELDLRDRKIELPGGVTLWCHPLTLGAYHRWLSLVVRAGSGELKNVTPELTDAALAILKESLIRIEGLQVRTSEGVGPGTLDDLVQLGGAALTLLMRAAAELFKSSSLTEADLGNSGGQPTAGPAAPAQPQAS